MMNAITEGDDILLNQSLYQSVVLMVIGLITIGILFVIAIIFSTGPIVRKVKENSSGRKARREARRLKAARRESARYEARRKKEEQRRGKIRWYHWTVLCIWILLAAANCADYVIGYKSMPVVESVSIGSYNGMAMSSSEYEVNSDCTVTKYGGAFDEKRYGKGSWTISRADWNRIVAELRLLQFKSLPKHIEPSPLAAQTFDASTLYISVDFGDTTYTVGGYDAGIGFSGGNLRFSILYDFIMDRLEYDDEE